MTCQRDKDRLCNNLRSKVDCKQSHAIIIDINRDCKTAKQQSCNKNWTQINWKLAKQQLCKKVCTKHINWQMHKDRFAQGEIWIKKDIIAVQKTAKKNCK